MDRQRAERRYRALCNMTVDRGCSANEAAIARRLARALALKFGFADTPVSDSFRADFDARWERAERRAAMRYAWEYRACSKQRCHCMKYGTKHGPYKYGKVRAGRKISSVYLGR